MNRLTLRFAIFSIALMMSSSLFAESFSGVVYNVFDGDTIEVRKLNRKHVTVHLAGIESPDLKDALGKQAHKFLEISTLKQMVRIFVKSKNKDGSLNAMVVLAKGDNVNQQMVRIGMAVTDRTLNDPQLAALEDKAKSEKLGLWKEVAPETPVAKNIE